MLLSSEERDTHANAKGDVAFFLNSAVLAFSAAALLIVDEVMNEPLPISAVAVYAIPFIAAHASYRLSVGAAQRLGDEIRGEYRSTSHSAI